MTWMQWSEIIISIMNLEASIIGIKKAERMLINIVYDYAYYRFTNVFMVNTRRY